MNSQLFFSSSSPALSLLCFVLTILVRIQSSSSNPDMCGRPFRCGSFYTGYPFWGGRDRPKFCGHPKLELSCETDDTAVTMRINEVKYRVLNINERDQILKIAREDYWFGLCPHKPQSPAEFISTTIDSELFDYTSGYENVTFQYGCPPSPYRTDTRFICSINGFKNVDGFIKVGSHSPGECSAKVTVPLPKHLLPPPPPPSPPPPLSPAGQPTASWVTNAIQSGFELKWKIGGMRCEDCKDSKGSCGYDVYSNKTICYCPNITGPSRVPCPTSPYPGTHTSPYLLYKFSHLIGFLEISRAIAI